MRHVDLEQLRRVAKRALFDELAAAMDALGLMSTDQERRDYIEKNGSKCSAFLHPLWMIGFGKCWYSEAKLPADAGEVEHFRPKRKVWKSTPPHGGYWWKAFDWRNFRLAHPLVNKRRKDYSTEQQAGKGCYFPLRHEERRAMNAPGEAREEPVLLDPIVPQDCRLLCFDGNSGKPIPRYKREDDPDGWRHRRASDSINFYHLDDGTWNSQREDLMRDVSILCDRVLEAAAKKDVTEYEKLLDEVAYFMHPFAEFSSAAAQVIREKGLLDHLSPLPDQTDARSRGSAASKPATPAVGAVDGGSQD